MIALGYNGVEALFIVVATYFGDVISQGLGIEDIPRLCLQQWKQLCVCYRAVSGENDISDDRVFDDLKDDFDFAIQRIFCSCIDFGIEALVTKCRPSLCKGII